jgi:predicted nucleic acid-binding protein
VALLLDSGVLYALADADDRWHVACRDYVAKARGVLLVPAMVAVEVAYLLHDRLGPGAELQFAQALARGELTMQPVTAPDLERCVVLLKKYPAIGLVDASVVALAERLRMKTIATTDRRHFASIRPAHVATFTLVP